MHVSLILDSRVPCVLPPCLPSPDVGPASVMVGNLVQGNRLASAQGRELGLMDNDDGMRRWRASTTENHEILTLLNAKGQVATSLTCAQLHKKAERVGCLLLEKGHINTGDHVALIYPPGGDLIAPFTGASMGCRAGHNPPPPPLKNYSYRNTMTTKETFCPPYKSTTPEMFVPGFTLHHRELGPGIRVHVESILLMALRCPHSTSARHLLLLWRMELCTKGLGSSMCSLKATFRESGLCQEPASWWQKSGREYKITNSFSKLFTALDSLPERCLTSFGCRVNVAVCLQGASSPDPTTVFVDLRSLRQRQGHAGGERRPSFHLYHGVWKAAPWGQGGHCQPGKKGFSVSDSHLGEIWVQCNHNATVTSRCTATTALLTTTLTLSW
ncbi:Disco-interacting protein 2 C [Chionoecetes opilio]|uniref:Disco-interacting protein 2 C n=1 Tax=Chionoecetes opilio TaxID=41210 RepID=A0A8J5D2L8_CHIOP|nr:Disco-interacting protein 2 C [Chionoecetes opilio]